MPKLHELQERRSTVVSEMRALNEAAERETRDYSAAEDQRHKELKKELGGLDRSIEIARDLQEAERAAPAVLHSGRLGDGHYETRARDFSLVKAINSRLGDVDVDAGFEREISAEVQRRSGRRFHGIAVPDQYFTEKRTLLVGSSAAQLYPETHLDSQFIDMLRARIIVGQLGATVLNDLVGDIDIPKQTSSSSAQWLAEDASLSETDAAFTDVTLSPKSVGAVTSYSRRTLINSLPSVENIVRNDLTSVIANAIDREALLGTGAGNTPTGVVSASGVNSLSFAAGPTWAQTLAFPAAVEGSNADVGSFGWALSPDAVLKFRGTLVAASTDSRMIMTEPRSLIGYPVAVSTVLTTGDSPDTAIVLFGVWSQLLVAYWSGVDILPNPYDSVSYLKGRVMLRVMRDCDVAVRHGAAFVKAINLPIP